MTVENLEVEEIQEEKEIETNMLRERAEKLAEVTDEMWEQVDEHNRKLVEDFFESNEQLSNQTLKQYKSGMRQFFWWVNVKAENKPMYEINKRDFIKYRSYLIKHGLSSNSLGFKQSSVSTLCNHIENIYAEDDKKYDTFKNFTRGLPKLPRNQVYEKVPITVEEYQQMMEYLEEKEDFMGMAWVATAFNIGGRRSELIQLETEIINYPYEKDENGNDLNFIVTKKIRGKGFGDDGKPLEYMINDEALKYIKLWIEKRGYKHKYVFTVNHNGENKRISPSWANYFCSTILSVVVGRRINVHLFKSSCITRLLSEGGNMKAISKYVAHHNDISTTQQFYDLRSDTEERNSIF